MDLDDVNGDIKRNDINTSDKDIKARNKDIDESGRGLYCDTCLFDDIETKAIAFCIRCIDYLCKDCLRDHRRSRMTRTHKVLEGSELPKNPDTFKMLKSMMSCPDHPETEVSFECKDHGTFICSHCLAVNHRKCEEFTEVGKTPGTDYKIYEMSDLLKSINENNVLVRTSKEENIEVLHLDQTVFSKDRADVIAKVHKRLNLLEEYSMAESEKVFEAVLKGLEKEVNECKVMENDATKHSELLDITMKYGNPAEINVISKLTHQRANVLKDHRTSYDRHTDVRIKFDGNKTITNLSTIGNTVICKGNKIENASVPSKKNTLESSSDSLDDTLVHKGDEVKTNTRNPGTKIYSKAPLLHSKVNRTRQMHDISEITNKRLCSMSGLLLLSDGHIVVADYSNQLIKILNLDFSARKVYYCNGYPIDMCQIFGGRLAVLLEDRKVINIYNVKEGNISYINEFKMKWYPISIDGPLESDDQVVVLFSDKEINSEDKRNIEIQIRNMRDGSIIRSFTDFKSKSSLQLVLQNPTRIRKMPKSQNAFLISESSKLYCFGILAQHENTLKEQWFYKSYNDNVIDGITDIAADNDGNIYVCGEKSKNIHQISGTNFRNNRVLLLMSGSPLSVCIDDEQRRVVIGAENDDFVYIAHFE